MGDHILWLMRAASVLGLTLMQALVQLSAAEPPDGADHPIALPPADALIMEQGRLDGDGPFQCGSRPGCFAVNPAGTLVAAATGAGYMPSQLTVFTIPEARRQTWQLPPLYAVRQLIWLDDHRLVLLGQGFLTSTLCSLSEDGWQMQQVRHRGALYALVDLTSGLVRTCSLPSTWLVIRMAAGGDHRSVSLLILPRAGFVAPGALLGIKNAHMQSFMGIEQLDVESGSLAWRGQLPGPFKDGPLLMAVRPDAKCCAVLMPSPRVGVEELVIIDQVTQHVISSTLLPGLPGTAVDLRWGRDDRHLEVRSVADDLSTLTLSLGDGRWTLSSGWVLRPSAGAGGAPQETVAVGLHAVTMADGRYVSLLPRSFRSGDLFHEPYAWTTTNGLFEPLVADDALHVGVTLLGSCLRVMNLQHPFALSPTPETFFECQNDARYLASGELAVSANQATFIIPEHGPLRQVPFLDKVDGSWATAGRWMIASIDQDRFQVVDAFTGACRQLPCANGALMIHMSPDGGAVLLRLESQGLRFVELDRPQDFWDLPCSANADPLEVAWSHDHATCYLAGDGMADGSGDCTGAWSTRERCLVWRAQDASGQDVTTACALIPDPTSHQVLVQYRLPGANPQAGGVLADGVNASQTLLCNGLLDASTGHWLSTLVNPGRDPAFTPDGQRVVGMLGVVAIHDNRMLQPSSVPLSRGGRLWMSPSRTWELWMPTHADWQLRDCANCHIILHIRRPDAVPEREMIADVVWDASEQHIAITFRLNSCIFSMPLLPPGRPQRFAATILPRVDAIAGWLDAAQDLAGMGRPAVDALAGAPLTAHRLIALEMLSRAGEHQADRVLDAAGTLPAPLGFLAHDCAFRIHQLRAQEALMLQQTTTRSRP